MLQPSGRQIFHLRANVRYGIVIDNIDLDEATRLGIYVPDVHDSKPEQSNRHTADSLVHGEGAKGT